MISSPHDTDARYSSRGERTWVGYAEGLEVWHRDKVHLTETCDADTPNLITSVISTVGTESDSNVTQKIHHDLNEQELLPSEHLMDMGYSSVNLLLDSRCEYSIELICPMRPDNSWQARTEGASR